MSSLHQRTHRVSCRPRARFIRSETSDVRTAFARSGVSDVLHLLLDVVETDFATNLARRNRRSSGAILVRSNAAREQNHKECMRGKRAEAEEAA